MSAQQLSVEVLEERALELVSPMTASNADRATAFALLTRAVAIRKVRLYIQHYFAQPLSTRKAE